MALLTTASGDGSVRVDVDAYGAFGSAGVARVSDALYDPVGEAGPSTTTFESAVALDVAGAAPPQFLAVSFIGSSGRLEDPGFLSIPGEVASRFDIGGLSFRLTQTAADLVDGDAARTGSQITQSYLITNSGAAPIGFDLFRYFDGDLLLSDDSIAERGGLLIDDGQRVLFQIEPDDDLATAATFVGITATGGDTSGPGRFELSAFPDVESSISNGTPLNDQIAGDGADPDLIVDSGNELDVTLGLRNSFMLAPGETATYTTTTIFGTGSPVATTPTPETANLFLAGTPEPDFLEGTSGREVFRGRASGDFLSGRAGDDRFFGGIGNDDIVAGAGNDVLFGNGGSDRLSGNRGDDRIVAGFGDDFAFGGGGDDLVKGGVGDDRVSGGGGNDELLGGRGSDRILGGAGDDTLLGGFGDDIMTGGSGSDVFRYRGVRDAADIITDFEVSTDLIDVSRLLRRAGIRRNAQVLGNVIQIGVQDGETALFFDRDGLAGSRERLQLAVLTGVTSDLGAASFIFS